jgi:hypothetical protein
VIDAHSPTPSYTFLLRLWQEWSAEGVQWRGRIHEVQSGRAAAFVDRQGLIDYLEDLGVHLDSRTESNDDSA